MNYYERIQKSIDYIEDNLENKINLDLVVNQAYMSKSNYYRMFFALIGYSVKAYIRQRRVSLASIELVHNNMNIIDIAIKYDFSSGDAFSRAFKKITGFLPSEFKKTKKNYSFERVNIMDKYFEVQDKALLEKYPDIKVLKEIKPMKVAYYCYYGKNPEENAFLVIKEWLKKSDFNNTKQDFRIFGFNNPSPSNPQQEEYGYEVCVTIDEEFIVKDENIKSKVLDGGLYAVIGIRPDKNGELGNEIMRAWKRFGEWLKDSKYRYGGYQWLEEHLGFDKNYNHIGGIDLYMPIIKKDTIDITKTYEHIQPMWTASYKVEGRDATEKARKYFLKWADAEGLFNNSYKHKFFAYYNHERMGEKDFFYKIHVSIPREFKTDDPNIKLEEFKGGYYAVMKSKFKYNGASWGEFIDWVSKSKEFCFGDYWFFEEYKINEPRIRMETDMILYMPIKPK
ncbi:AraC family transcriptional regulator [Vallitalea pronyensis]|uniref:AraC family transcriptional regulator n=1 Tax=Vallitalea pronyensis TaxID=1348613 RepID=A0A8J8SHG6_9FIRM|nr:effector binding domain-containing protein [Vallitalea pronyensis]QUI23414.1 AraC family transcriptional regulator [Vallitalea pronyensis]